ncbi:MAG: SPOR domain-containing protein [Acidobacteriaceae bacterium]
MNSMNQIDDLDDAPQHSEITLGTATLLGIFLGLVLVCAVFFGLGYSLGRRSIQTSSAGDTATDSANFGSFKPSPGNPALQPTPRGDSSTVGNEASAARAAAAELASATGSDAPAPATPRTKADAAAPTTSSAIPPTAAAHPVAATPTTANVASQFAQPALPVMVQIAAVSHQEDADVLVKALKRQGHDVIARQDPADRLIHVQIGPFASRKEAEAMRQTLLTEGYNAIVK